MCDFSTPADLAMHDAEEARRTADSAWRKMKELEKKVAALTNIIAGLEIQSISSQLKNIAEDCYGADGRQWLRSIVCAMNPLTYDRLLKWMQATKPEQLAAYFGVKAIQIMAEIQDGKILIYNDAYKGGASS